jgi:hypothetical protein
MNCLNSLKYTEEKLKYLLENKIDSKILLLLNENNQLDNFKSFYENIGLLKKIYEFSCIQLNVKSLSNSNTTEILSFFEKCLNAKNNFNKKRT